MCNVEPANDQISIRKQENLSICKFIQQVDILNTVIAYMCDIL